MQVAKTMSRAEPTWNRFLDRLHYEQRSKEVTLSSGPHLAGVSAAIQFVWPHMPAALVQLITHLMFDAGTDVQVVLVVGKSRSKWTAPFFEWSGRFGSGSVTSYCSHDDQHIRLTGPGLSIDELPALATSASFEDVLDVVSGRKQQTPFFARLPAQADRAITLRAQEAVSIDEFLATPAIDASSGLLNVLHVHEDDYDGFVAQLEIVFAAIRHQCCDAGRGRPLFSRKCPKSPSALELWVQDVLRVLLLLGMCMLIVCI